MMKGKILVMAVAIVFLSASVAWATVTGIVGTKHDLSHTGFGPLRAAAGVQGNEVCIWCHTPHHAASAAEVGPLWNKPNPAGPFTLYGPTLAGTPAPTALSPTSRACLSCHDGVSAINRLVNLRGAGGLVAAGTVIDFPTATGARVLGGAVNIGTALTNDHPVSITYDVTAPIVAGLRPTTHTLTGWHRAPSVGALLRAGRVECSSCHDPHVGGTTYPLFLRHANTGSALCLGCHAM